MCFHLISNIFIFLLNFVELYLLFAIQIQERGKYIITKRLGHNLIVNFDIFLFKIIPKYIYNYERELFGVN